MPANPRSGMSYKGGNDPAQALKKTRVAGGSPTATQEEELSPIDFQDAHGNEYLNDLIKSGQGAQTEKGADTAIKAMPLPPEVRFRLLSSNDIQILASLIYSHATPSETVTKEMLAIGSMYFNRWEETLARPDKQKEFGAANFQGLLFDVQRKMPLYHKPDRLTGFSNASKFGADLPSQLDMKTACAAIKAAEQIYTGVNPFPERFMYMDISGACTQPEKVQTNTHMQFGKLHFWAAKPESTTQGEGQQSESSSPLASTAAEPTV